MEVIVEVDASMVKVLLESVLAGKRVVWVTILDLILVALY